MSGVVSSDAENLNMQKCSETLISTLTVELCE